MPLPDVPLLPLPMPLPDVPLLPPPIPLPDVLLVVPIPLPLPLLLPLRLLLPELPEVLEPLSLVELPLPGIMLLTLVPMVVARSLTCSTTRLITLRASGLALRAAAIAAVPAAAPVAAAIAVRVMRVRLAFLPALRRTVVFLAAVRLRVAAPLRAEALFFELLRFFELFFDDEERLFDDRFFDDFLLELFDPRFFEAFFEDLLEERRFFAAMLCLLLTMFGVGEPYSGSGFTLRATSGARVAPTQFRRTCLDCHASDCRVGCCCSRRSRSSRARSCTSTSSS
jgi:hypothetical protein